jgi:hypothetical protein
MRVASSAVMQDLDTRTAVPHVENVKQKLHEIVVHLRRDTTVVDDPKAIALLEMSADVIEALERALQHFAESAEPAWRP